MEFRLFVGKARALLATVILAGFVVNAGLTAWHDRSRALGRVTTRALVFAELTKGPIVTAYRAFHPAGFFKFRELLRDRLSISRDVERIQIADVTGRILVDSDTMDSATPGGHETVPARLIDPALLTAVKATETTLVPVNPSTRGRFAIVAPHLADWGRHEYSLIYHVRADRDPATSWELPLIEHMAPALALAGVTIAGVLALLRRPA